MEQRDVLPGRVGRTEPALAFLLLVLLPGVCHAGGLHAAHAAARLQALATRSFTNALAAVFSGLCLG